MYKKEDPQGNESLKIKWEIVEYTRGHGLDLGCGPNKPFAHFIGVDNNADAHLFNTYFRPDMTVPTAERLPMYASDYFDFVFSSHLLEHIKDHKSALKEWFRVVKPGGYLVLYLPHKDLYPNMGEGNPDHKHDFVNQDIIDAMQEIKSGWTMLEDQVRDGDVTINWRGKLISVGECSFYQVYRKDTRPGHRFEVRKRFEKSAAVVRFGAFGDMMQTTSVIKGLKDQGYKVTLHCSPPASDCIIHDPNIDRIILQDPNQVPNQDLGEYFQYLYPKYDKWVNLCESVEGVLLHIPGRAVHSWPKNLRHRLSNFNYLEMAHQIAGVEHKPQVKFYPSKDEKEWAVKERKKYGDFTVLWSLAGSSVHKTWPHMDTIIARLLLRTDLNIHVILTGGYDCKILEQGWENEPRVHKKSGEWSIRETFTMLEHVDLVVGPETGVLNAACCLKVPKIVFLSHSTNENLTRDWVNTYALEPTKTACWPCHQLHYGWTYCKQVTEGAGNGAAQCSTDIGPEACWNAVTEVLRNFEVKAA